MAVRRSEKGLGWGRRSARLPQLMAVLVCAAALAASWASSQASAADPRGYELVSPQDKNGGNLDRDLLVQDNATSGASESGDAVAYAGSSQFADPVAGAAFSQYLSARADTGWVTRNISPRVDAELLAPPTSPRPSCSTCPRTSPRPW